MTETKKRSYRQSIQHWLSLGMGVKRWLLIALLSGVVMGLGLIGLVDSLTGGGWLSPALHDLLSLSSLPGVVGTIVVLCSGLAFFFLAVGRLGANLVEPFRQPGDSLAASIYYHSRRSRGPNVVAIGGGTGMPALLRGLKQSTRNITAIVTVADDGGSSGRLREELGMLPPGDFRNNIAALSEDEALMTHLLQYRFGGRLEDNGQNSLRGHAFGNLLLAALTGVTGSFDAALLAAERVLAMRGRVLPSTLEQVALVAEIGVVEADGRSRSRRVVGESAIPKAGGNIQQISLDPSAPRAYPPAVQAILQADLIVLGPGSLYTSILPNLLVPSIASALRHTNASRIYICNIAVQPGETDAYSVADHVDAIARYAGEDCLDLVLANDRLPLPVAAGETVPVELAWPPQIADGVRLITADLVDENRPWRHDSRKIAELVERLLQGVLLSDRAQ